MSKVFGIGDVKLNDVSYRAKQGMEVDLGGYRATPQFSAQGLDGYSEEHVAAGITVVFQAMGDTDVDAIREFGRDGNGRMSYITDVGVVFAITSARITEPPKLTDNGGGYSCTFAGKPAKSV